MTACHDVPAEPVTIAGDRRVDLVVSPNAGKTRVFKHTKTVV
jgi:ferrous iron transport protein B